MKIIGEYNSFRVYFSDEIKKYYFNWQNLSYIIINENSIKEINIKKEENPVHQDSEDYEALFQSYKRCFDELLKEKVIHIFTGDTYPQDVSTATNTQDVSTATNAHVNTATNAHVNPATNTQDVSTSNNTHDVSTATNTQDVSTANSNDNIYVVNTNIASTNTYYHRNSRQKNYPLRRSQRANVFISIKFAKQNLICERYECIPNCEHDIIESHITFGRYGVNPKLLPEIFNRKSAIYNYIEDKLKNLPNSRAKYRILGKDPKLDSIKSQDLNTNSDFNMNEDDCECYLARVFDIGDYSELYNLIHQNDEKSDYNDFDFYTENDYKNFIVHLSIAKFYKISDAVKTYKNICDRKFQKPLQNILSSKFYLSISY